MEGNIYLCQKKKVMGIYNLELLDNPSIKTKGLNLEICKEDICMQIIEWNGDGEAVLEFLPDGIKKTSIGLESYVSLEYNDSVDILNINELYTIGICPKCKYAKGKRTNEILDLEFLPSGKKMILGINAKAKKDKNDFNRLFPKITIYHKELINAIIDNEKSIEIREVFYKGKKSDYLELIPKDIIKNSGCKIADYDKHPFLKSWRCSKCGREELHFWTEQYQWNNNMVDISKVSSFPDIIFMDTGLHISLCIRKDIWQNIGVNKRILTEPVIVLYKENIDYPNHLNEPEQFEW